MHINERADYYKRAEYVPEPVRRGAETIAYAAPCKLVAYAFCKLVVPDKIVNAECECDINACLSDRRRALSIMRRRGYVELVDEARLNGNR